MTTKTQLDLKDRKTIEFDNIILNNDRILVSFKSQPKDIRKGIYVPYDNNSSFKQGYVIKVGPGYPSPSFEDESLKDKFLDENKSKPKYIPLQFEPGDLIVFDSKLGVELIIDGEHYYIVKDQEVEIIYRDKDLFN